MPATEAGHLAQDKETFRAAVMGAKFQHGQARR